MNIQHIKAAIAKQRNANIPTLTMVRQLDQQTQAPQPWLSHWDDETRTRITMHEDVFQQIKSNPEKADLAFKVEEVPATQTRAAYTRYVVITPKNIEGTF